MGTSIDSGYAELRCKSNYSFLTGASHPEELVEQAHALGLCALALTDQNGVYGVPRAYRSVKKLIGLKLIVGSELTVDGRPPITLLARDRAAYGLLCRVITQSHSDKPKGHASLQWTGFLEMMQRPQARGLVVFPTDGPNVDYPTLVDLFQDRVFIPLTRVLDGRDKNRTARARDLSRTYGLKIVATNDVHCHTRKRRRLQDVMTAIRNGTTLSSGGKKLFSNSERFLKTPAQMYALFNDMPDAVARTVDIADSFFFCPSELRYYYPSEWIPEGKSAQSYLEELVWSGAKGRYAGNVPPEVRRQILHELSLIQTLKFADYFLTIWDIVEFARRREILCQGRGSAANSVVCYCLGITAIDPVRMNLLFERFISVERGEPPDIDVDFEHERREEVIQYIYEKYGRHRAAMVSAVIRYRSRSASRECAKVMEVDLERIRSDEEKNATEKLTCELADELYGFPRHLSIHSGGFTLSSDPLIETVPIEPARMEGRTIVQWDKDDLDAIGLLKIDVLALGMLTAIQKTCRLVGNIDLTTIPAEDLKTYQMIQKGDTIGVFQIESRAQINMLGRLQPKNFYDLVVQVAIVRPGPISGKMVHPYLKRRHGQESPDVPDPRLEPILRKTLGVPLFQEQVMKIAIVMAGFTPGEADELRRAIGAWRSSGSIEKIGRKLMNGLLASGLPRHWVERIFEQIKGFAEYGFPESHAASFALLAYASSYLKCHYPAQFTCALLNSQPMGFYSPHSLVDDVKRRGVAVLPVDPNCSEWDCRLENGAIRLGWRVVKGMRHTDADQICMERKKSPFVDISDFLARVRIGPVVLQRLAMGGAFECFRLDQRQSLWRILAHGLSTGPDPSGQLSLFKNMPLHENEAVFEALDSYQAIRTDYKSYGLSVRGHPMTALRQKMPRIPKTTARKVKLARHGDLIVVAGLIIVRQRPPTAAGTVFAALEDETGFLDLILHKPTYIRYEELFLTHSFLIAKGTVQRSRDSVSLLVRQLRPIYSEDEHDTNETRIARSSLPSLSASLK